MNDIEEKILESYIRDYSIEADSHRILGKMLDEEFVRDRLEKFKINEMYIYGGTYLAIQLHRTANKYVNVKGIIDKNGKIITNDDIPVFYSSELKNIYAGENIVVTPMFFFDEITKELETFVDKEKIIYIGELIEGKI